MPCHMSSGTPYLSIHCFSLINFVNPPVSVKIAAWLECKENTELKDFLKLSLFPYKRQ
jgi:hypothetical protein